jgi:Flp pilus assembly protein TadG
MRLTGSRNARGQALAEFALVFPMFLLLLMSIVVFGLYVFYNEQLANAAREAARYAAVHSSTAQCPTVSRLDPPQQIKPRTYTRCDTPEAGWPKMTAAARSKVWGMDPGQVSLTACWSGYVDASNNYDAWPAASPNTFTDCTMRGTSSTPINPRTDPDALPCPTTTAASTSVPPTADGDDKASDTAVDTSLGNHYATTVTVYACFVWTPPMAGFVVIPNQITLRAVITEAQQRQQ